eukprot:scaffold289732_cov35-Tisochrysis_lutea.AAC.5
MSSTKGWERGGARPRRRIHRCRQTAAASCLRRKRRALVEACSEAAAASSWGVGGALCGGGEEAISGWRPWMCERRREERSLSLSAWAALMAASMR